MAEGGELEIFWPVVDALLDGPEARHARHAAADRVKFLWEANIHPETGETQLLLHDDTDAATGSRTYIETGDAGPTKHDPVNRSAWKWLEYGTSKMEAQSPGRRALSEAEIE